MWIHYFLLVACAQMGELGAQSERYSFAQTVLSYPVTAIIVCLTFGVLFVLGIFYLKKIIENMSEVKVLIKKNNKEHKYLLGEVSEKFDFAK